MKNNRFLQMIGLATKAGKIVSGEFSVEQSLKKGEALLVIIAEDASDNTKKHFTDMCAFRGIPVLFAGDKNTLGRFTGKQERASIAVTDKGFADSLLAGSIE